MIPTGVLADVGSVLLGGLTGGLAGNKLSEHFKTQLTMVFGVCSVGMGIYSIAPMKNMPAVIFALVIGIAIGLIAHLGNRINKGAALMQVPISKIFPSEKLGMTHDEFINTLVTVTVLFCVGGTGIYGNLDPGMTGNSTILISKPVLDFFTAAIFACNLGYVVSVVAIPQLTILYILFLLARSIYPLTIPDIILDFKACDGFLVVAISFRMINVKMLPVVDMIPAAIVTMLLNRMWTGWIMPLL